MENKKETVFADGIIFKKPREGAPEFIKGAISIKVEDFIKFLQANNSDGWVNLDLKKSAKGNLYLSLNSWKKGDTGNKSEVPFD